MRDNLKHVQNSWKPLLPCVTIKLAALSRFYAKTSDKKACQLGMYW